jgi:hypothetical protein
MRKEYADRWAAKLATSGALLRRIPRRDCGDAVGRSRLSRPKIILFFGS